MFSFKMLLSALTLTLLAVSVESGDFLLGVVNIHTSSEHREIHDNQIHPKTPKDDDVNFDSPVLHADRMVRPVRSLKSAYGPISHSGVRVTLEDGSQWLIHKGNSNGVDSPMVVTSTENMSSKWKSVETREFNGTKTVADFVKAGGDAYDLRRANCHHATDAMMNQ